MRIATIVKHQVTLPVHVKDLFSWFSREGAFYRLIPPWQKIALISRDPGLEAGNRTVFRIFAGPFSLVWIAEHVDYEVEQSFTDMQIRGPFRYFRHQHTFRKLEGDSSSMEDTIRFIPPGGPLLDVLLRRFFKKSIKSMLRYRARVLFNDLTCLSHYNLPPKRILIAGGSGFIGQELSSFLRTQGHSVYSLTRLKTTPHDIAWDVEKKELDPQAIEGFDIIINLAGESIAKGRWNAAKKARILSSRIESTRLLVETMNKVEKKPEVFVSASAIGIYGIHPQEECSENTPKGRSFLADVCAQWEEEAQKAPCRVVNTRFGLVLSPKGGALKKMLLPFSLGLGGNLGDGTQKMSWISLDDVLYGMYHVIANAEIQGPVNFVTEHSVTNAEFTKSLGAVLKRFTLFPLPRFLIRILFGQMGEETLLGSAEVTPSTLSLTDYTFAYPTIKKALEHMLRR